MMLIHFILYEHCQLLFPAKSQFPTFTRGENMTIRYSNGKIFDCTVLSQQGGRIRAAVQGFEDVVEFTARNGMWLTEDWEPVQMAFEGHASNEVVSEADCICPKELASFLIQSLQYDSDDLGVERGCPRVLAMGASSC